MHHRMRTTMTGLLITLALLLAACAGQTADSAGDYNDADVTFLQGMVPHHAQAVEMAELVPPRSDREELQELAEQIIAAQEAEISEMEGYLDGAGAEADDAMAMGDGDMSDMGGMSGMMSQDEMGRLAELDGAAFELMFLDMMIEHHLGAIESAERVIDDGENPEVSRLANEIIAEQEAEIEQMTAWREEWAAESS
jgi:uncharacterized protein (DUF305 family)